MTQVERCKPIVDILIEQLAQQKPHWLVNVNYVLVNPLHAFEVRIDDKAIDRAYLYTFTTFGLAHLEQWLKRYDGPDAHERLAHPLISSVEKEFSAVTV